MKARPEDIEFVKLLRGKGLSRGDAMGILAGLKERDCLEVKMQLKRRMAAVVEIYDAV